MCVFDCMCVYVKLNDSQMHIVFYHIARFIFNWLKT